MLGAFQRQRLHEADQRQLGGAVVALAEVAVQPGGRGGHQDAPVFLRHHVRPGRLDQVHGAHQVHIQHQAEIGQIHLGEALVAQDAGVADQRVDAAPGVQRLLHQGLHGLEIGDGSAAGHGLAAAGADFLHHALGGGGRAAAAVHRAAQVIDHHLGTALGQRQRMQASQAAAGAGDDGHAAREIDLAHVVATPLERILTSCQLYPSCGAVFPRPATQATAGRPSLRSQCAPWN